MVFQGFVYTCESSIIVRTSHSTPGTTILVSASIFGLDPDQLGYDQLEKCKIDKKPERFNLLVYIILLQLAFSRNCFILHDENIKNAPWEARTPDLRITSARSAVHASTAYKYEALTNCATGA